MAGKFWQNFKIGAEVGSNLATAYREGKVRKAIAEGVEGVPEPSNELTDVAPVGVALPIEGEPIDVAPKSAVPLMSKDAANKPEDSVVSKMAKQAGGEMKRRLPNTRQWQNHMTNTAKKIMQEGGTLAQVDEFVGYATRARHQGMQDAVAQATAALNSGNNAAAKESLERAYSYLANGTHVKVNTGKDGNLIATFWDEENGQPKAAVPVTAESLQQVMGPMLNYDTWLQFDQANRHLKAQQTREDTERTRQEGREDERNKTLDTRADRLVGLEEEKVAIQAGKSSKKQIQENLFASMSQDPRNGDLDTKDIESFAKHFAANERGFPTKSDEQGEYVNLNGQKFYMPVRDNGGAGKSSGSINVDEVIQQGGVPATFMGWLNSPVADTPLVRAILRDIPVELQDAFFQRLEAFPKAARENAKSAIVAMLEAAEEVSKNESKGKDISLVSDAIKDRLKELAMEFTAAVRNSTPEGKSKVLDSMFKANEEFDILVKALGSMGKENAAWLKKNHFGGNHYMYDGKP